MLGAERDELLWVSLFAVGRCGEVRPPRRGGWRRTEGPETGRASSPLTLFMVLLMEVLKGVLGLVLRVIVFGLQAEALIVLVANV